MKSPLAFLLIVLAAATAPAATFTVTSTSDSGPGSLRQAILDANGDQSPPTLINFNIQGTGVRRITVASRLPTISGPLTIDGYTQPGARANTATLGTDAVLLIEINGQQVGGTGLTITDDNNVVRGLIINGFTTDIELQHQGHAVRGCYLGTDASGSVAIARPTLGSSVFVSTLANSILIGGPAPADRNVIAGNVVWNHCTAITVQGNYIGVSADGVSFIAPSATVGGDGNNVSIGGTTTGAGNVIAGRVSLANSAFPLVQFNLIGTNASGTTASPGAGGMGLVGGTGVGTLGLTTNGTIFQNVIVNSNSGAAAVVVLAGARNNIFKANLVGLGADGKTALGNRPIGFHLQSRCSGNQIGGFDVGEGNVIAFRGTPEQLSAGIYVPSVTAPVSFANGANFIYGNTIIGNIGLPIDLAAQGVTANDMGDGDGVQNSPVLTSVVLNYSSQTVRIAGTLDSAANTTFRLEFFGHGISPQNVERRFSLGFWDVTTDGNGHASFDATMRIFGVFTPVSATATGPAGTSEFSPVFSGKLLNISTRAHVGTGDDIVIGGFIVTGNDVKKVLLRGIGPSMSVGGAPVPGRLEDPVIALYDSSGNRIGLNNDWQDSQEADIEATGLAPTDGSESALLATLQPEAYTVHLLGLNGRTGIGLVEIYDLTPQSSGLANISTRARVETGNNVVIGGFIIGPNDRPAGRVLVRGLGPSLVGVPNPLQDPRIELRNSDGMVLASNDNWRDDETRIAATGIPPTDDRESAIAVAYGPGNYTVILRGRDDSTGVGLIEIYQL